MQYRQRILDHMSNGSAENIAVEGNLGGRTGALNYRQLKNAVLQLCQNHLVGSNVIGVFCNRSIEAYVGVLSSFYAGKTFVPLNPKFSDQKLSRIIELAKVDTLLHSQKETERKTIGLCRSINLSEEIFAIDLETSSLEFAPSPAAPTDVVYHMFTSGSTGDPKGVPINHGNLNAYVTGISQLISFGLSKRFSQVFDLSFDLSMHDIFVCFYHYGTLVGATDMDLMLPSHYIQNKSIDHWFSVPILADAANKTNKKGQGKSSLTTALFCGEALPLKTAKNFLDIFVLGDAVWNLYGPTEATIAFSARKISQVSDSVDIAPLGEGFGNNQLAIETPEGGVVTCFEDGTEGHLLLGGKQIFTGYSPTVDSDVFINHDNMTLYRSGDLVKFSNNELLYLGRVDHQVKIRGYRVELSEIEVTFRRIFGIEMVAAFTVGNVGDLKIHLAYQSDNEIDEIKRLREWLPEYMMPEKIRRFDKLPLNSNGKIDRKSLANTG